MISGAQGLFIGAVAVLVLTALAVDPFTVWAGCHGLFAISFSACIALRLFAMHVSISSDSGPVIEPRQSPGRSTA